MTVRRRVSVLPCFSGILASMARILVVEDDPAERMSIQELIAHDDVNITAVGTGHEALAAMHEREYDCVVLDLRLPDMSGFELLTEVQKEPALRDVLNLSVT